MKIAIDCDGVLVDFNTGFLRLLCETSGRELATLSPTTRRYDPDTWDWPKALGYTSKEISAAWAKTNELAWWEELEPLPGAALFLDHLAARCYDYPEWEAYFVTSRQRKTAYIKEQTEVWIREHSPNTRNATVLVNCAHKGDVCQALGLDGLIDDKPSHLFEAERACGPTFRTFLKATTYTVDSKLPQETIVLHTWDDFWRAL